jgi:hypothetical protein
MSSRVTHHEKDRYDIMNVNASGDGGGGGT